MIEWVLFESSPLPVAALTGPNHTLRYVNPAFAGWPTKRKTSLLESLSQKRFSGKGASLCWIVFTASNDYTNSVRG